MAHFYGTLQGNRGEATRAGSKMSGMTTVCASWSGAVQCQAFVNDDGEDWVVVEKVNWCGVGERKVLYDGPIGKAKS